jgi:hypothetical protein
LTKLDIFGVHDFGAKEARLKDDALDAELRSFLLQTLVPSLKGELCGTVLGKCQLIVFSEDGT